MDDLINKLTYLRTRWYFIVFLLIILLLIIFETINVILEDSTHKSVHAYATKNENLNKDDKSNIVNIDLTKNP